MVSTLKKIIFTMLILLSIFIIVELVSFLFLNIYFHYRIKNSKCPKLFEDTKIYLSLDRFHPLFRNNNDLRAKSPDLDFDPILGYKFAPNTIHVRPYPDYTSYIEIDSQGFVHNGDPDKNKRLLAKDGDKLYRIIFLGGSTTAGRGASSNEHTIPAYFERQLEEEWQGVEFHVINAGNFGYSSTEEHLYYSFYLKQIKPDLIIFLDGDNDVMLFGQKQWTPYFHDMKFTNAKYRSMFRPNTAFANYIQSLLTFPQPLYSLFFIQKFLYKTKLAINKLAKPKNKEEFIFHKERCILLKNNLLTSAREISFENSKAFFFLQPVLNIKKNNKSEKEKEMSQIMEIIYSNYQKNLEKYFYEFSNIYEELQKIFSNNDKINFVDISDIFENNSENIYVSGWHYNDYGNKIIAEKIFDYTKKTISKDLMQKGLIK